MTREKPIISKLSRKVGEKLRRDKLNTLITNLAEEVPTIKYAQRRPDKLAILRLTVSYLKLHHGLKKRKKVTQCLKSFGCLYGAAKAAVDGVIFITTKAGTILYVSENIRNFLGYHQMDVIGYNMDKFIHEGDLKTFNSQFLQQSRTLATFTDEIEGNTLQAVEVHNKNKNYFAMRMLYAAKKRSEGEPNEERYESMYFASFLDQHDENLDCEPWLVAIMKPTGIFSEVEVTVSDFMRTNEFATLHDLDGTVLASDHRAALFHGFMPTEVVGKSAYKLVIEEDLQHISRSHKLILKEDQIPVTVYRVHSLLGPHVYLQTRSIIVCDKWTKQPKCIVSVHTAHSEEDGRKLLQQQRRRYSLSDLSTEENNLDKKPENSSSSSNGTVHSTKHFSEKTNKSFQNSLEKNNNVSNLDKNHHNTSSTKESLCEVFEKEAKSYPGIYSKELMSHRDRNRSVSGVKRSYDETENVNKSEPSCSEYVENSANHTKCSNYSTKLKNNSKESVNQNKETIAEPPKSSKGTYRKVSKDKTEPGGGHKMKKPILKGLLEGQLTMNSYIYPDEGPLAMFMKTNEPDSSSASSVDDCETSAGDNKEIGASDISIFQPSLAGTSDNDSEFKSNFILQLHLKHTQLKDILFEQKNTVQLLRNQLALGTETVQLDPKNMTVHNSLLGKILEAENQIDVQAGVLREIEEELKV